MSMTIVNSWCVNSLTLLQLAARAAERDLADIKRENAHLRQK